MPGDDSHPVLPQKPGGRGVGGVARDKAGQARDYRAVDVDAGVRHFVGQPGVELGAAGLRDEGGVGDVVHAGAHGPLDALNAVGMGCRPLAQAVGLVEHDPKLLDGELGEPRRGAAGREAAGGHRLDRVDPHEVVAANLAANLVHGVGGAAGMVGVSAGGGDLRAGGDDARPPQFPGIDGVAQGDVHVVPRPERLHARDALAEQLAGGAGSVEGEAGDLVRPVVGVFDVGPGGGKVIVGLDEPGHEGGAGQVQAHDLARLDVGNELAQAPFELRGGPRRQDLAPPH